MAQNYEIDIKRFNGQDYDTLLPTPAAHASTHQANGSDPITMQTGNYADGSITAEKLAPGAATTLRIADGAVTLPKIASTAFDSAPVEGSGKIITSGAVAEALANFTGGVEIVKLWENASPKSTFASQTVKLNLSEYEFLLTCVMLSTTNEVRNVCVSRTDGVNRLFVPGAGSDLIRDILPSSNSLLFGNAQQGGNIANNNLIPLALYGVKGVR